MSTHRTRPEPSDDGEPPVRRFDRVLAYGALILAGASVVCFFAIIIGTASGMDQAAFGEGAWPIAAALPMYGLPLAFLMIIALLIMTFVRKGRAGKRS
ncbi:multidrug ABC transporter ATPase [Microbacterium sp.]|uniref:multidrug ABC transporter ATPase n=1 Tax=Microbacterium sp. TaxID=51671 RepID=UPI002810D287|nr:multidrug ABC transporter ATPase [Microbacterium sp.]